MLLREVTGKQLREARLALGYSLHALGTRAVNRVCVRVYEPRRRKSQRAHPCPRQIYARALQADGIEFLDDGGVQLHRLATTINGNAGSIGESKPPPLPSFGTTAHNGIEAFNQYQ